MVSSFSSSSSYRLLQRKDRRRRGRRKVAAREDVTSQKIRSNDSSDEVGSDLGIVNGYPTTYSCYRYVRSQQTQTMQLSFNYELLIQDPDEEALESYLPGLKWGMLWSVAKAIGLHSCDLNAQKIDKWSGRRNLAAAIGKSSDIRLPVNGSSHVISLATADLDEDYASVVGSCRQIVDPPLGTTCLPMHGVMTAEYTGDNVLAVENYLQFHIAQEIDAQHVLVGDVLEAAYVGNELEHSTFHDESDSSFIALATSLSLVALVIIATSVILLISRKRRQSAIDISKSVVVIDCESAQLENNVTGQTEETDYISVEDPCASPPIESLQLPAAHDISLNCPSGLGSSSSSEEEPEDLLPPPPPPPPARPEVVQGVPPTITKEVLPPLAPTALAPSSQTSAPITVSAPLPITMGSASLPHIASVSLLPTGSSSLPPTAPASKPPPPPGTKSRSRSRSMKKRRRRKKKKRRPALVRVNSRESIKEMETIKEAEEEYDDDDEEEGSDYWTSDEDDSTGRHSRDPSPARSLGSASGLPPPIVEEPRIPPLPPPSWA